MATVTAPQQAAYEKKLNTDIQSHQRLPEPLKHARLIPFEFSLSQGPILTRKGHRRCGLLGRSRDIVDISGKAEATCTAAASQCLECEASGLLI